MSFGLYFFIKNVKRLKRNILLGKDIQYDGRSKERWVKMLKIALGQTKMVVRPVSGIMHLIVYIAFILINLELIEIVIDGLFGTHRVFKSLGAFYGFMIGTFEVLAVLVILAVAVFWARRNVLKLKRFFGKEMTSWPKNDANYILYFEWVLMGLFLLMNATDVSFQQMHQGNIVSAALYRNFEGLSLPVLHLLERSFWWAHIIGILIFLNYLYYSKHLHIILAFPNTFYSRLSALGTFKNNQQVTKEVQLMMDPDADPYAVDTSSEETEPETFGAKDVTDLSWVQLMNAYSCTECGRCTSECPANQTGKLLSPRAIMMKTRDRLEELGRHLDKNKESNNSNDGKQLLNDYISPEELWACTSCNACVQACPIGIDPLSIIMDMRQYLVMEESAAPQELNGMMTNIENNGAPWQFNQQDRLNWANEE